MMVHNIDHDASEKKCKQNFNHMCAVDVDAVKQRRIDSDGQNEKTLRIFSLASINNTE